MATLTVIEGGAGAKVPAEGTRVPSGHEGTKGTKKPRKPKRPPTQDEVLCELVATLGDFIERLPPVWSDAFADIRSEVMSCCSYRGA